MSTELDIDFGILEGLDFAPSCEHSQHERKHLDESAKYIVRALCGECRDNTVYLMCESGWKVLTSLDALYCAECGHCGDDVTVKIIDTLGK